MHKIHYSGAEFVTGDDIAEAVQSYALALAEAGKCAQASFPIVTPEGLRATATVLLGAGYSIAWESLPLWAEPELIDEGVAGSLGLSADRVRHPLPVNTEPVIRETEESNLFEY
jgi:hypothetical protein